VGVIGTVVNLALVWLGNAAIFTAFGEPLQTWLSLVLAIALSVFTNYVLHYLWTWRDRRLSGIGFFFLHLFKYYMAAAVTASLQFLIASGLVYLLRLHYYESDAFVAVQWKILASLIGIVLSGVLNFLLNHFWNFNNKNDDNEDRVCNPHL